MRKSRVFALVVASLVSSASFAQAQVAAPGAKAERHEEHEGMRGMRGMGEGHGPLRGITLTDAEKAKLKEIHAKYATEAKSLRESLKPAMQEARAARQKGDTAGARAIRERNRSGRDQLEALHDRQVAEIRAVLTPEQQKQFDANLAEGARRRAELVKNGGKRGHRGPWQGRHKGPRAGTNG